MVGGPDVKDEGGGVGDDMRWEIGADGVGWRGGGMGRPAGGLAVGAVDLAGARFGGGAVAGVGAGAGAGAGVGVDVGSTCAEVGAGTSSVPGRLTPAAARAGAGAGDGEGEGAGVGRRAGPEEAAR